MTELPIQVRNYNPQIDQNFVFNSWLRSYQFSECAKEIQEKIYTVEQTKVIRNCIDKGMVSVACNPDDPEQIYGWIAGQEKEDLDGYKLVFHYLHIKELFRGFGIPKMLVDAMDRSNVTKRFYTHRHGIMIELAKKRGWIFNPYLIMQ